MESDYLLANREAWDQWDNYWNHVVIVSRTLARNRRPIVLVGWVSPSLIEKTASASYVSAVHLLVLTCDSSTQAERLTARYRFPSSNPPAPDSVARALNGTCAILEEAHERPNTTVLDTTDLTLPETTSMVDSWILQRMMVDPGIIVNESRLLP